MQSQSAEEWLEAYGPVDGEPEARPATKAYKPYNRERRSTPVNSDQPLSHPVIELVYSHHRTAKKYGQGSVVLAFVRTDTGEEVVAFFNVDTRKQRGAKKGEHYRIGRNGQFLPYRQGAFVQFWLATFGAPPEGERWSTCYKKLGSLMKGLIFTGEVTTEYVDSGEYLKVKALRKVTRSEQIGNNAGTIKEQEIGTREPAEPIDNKDHRAF